MRLLVAVLFFEFCISVAAQSSSQAVHVQPPQSAEEQVQRASRQPALHGEPELFYEEEEVVHAPPPVSGRQYYYSYPSYSAFPATYYGGYPPVYGGYGRSYYYYYPSYSYYSAPSVPYFPAYYSGYPPPNGPVGGIVGGFLNFLIG